MSSPSTEATPRRPFPMSAVIALLLALAVYAANATIAWPQFEPDESSYLARAAVLAGFDNDMTGSFHAGYSLFLTPAFLLADSPTGIWDLVRVVNTGLFLLTLFLLWRIARQLYPEQDRRLLAAATIITACYPIIIVMVGYSMAQNALIPAFLLTFLLLLRSPAGDLRQWLAMGIVAGFMYWIHPTGAVPVAALVLTAAWITWRHRCFAAFGALFLAVTGMTAIYKLGVTPWFEVHMSTSGLGTNNHYPDLSGMLSSLLSLEGIKNYLGHVSGQGLGLVSGSLGAAAIGAVVLFEKITGRAAAEAVDPHTDHRVVALFMLLTLGGTIAISSLMLTATPGLETRFDQWVYGRYTETFAIPLVLMGILGFTRQRLIVAIAVTLLSMPLLLVALVEHSKVEALHVPSLWQHLLAPDLPPVTWFLAVVLIMAALIPARPRVYMLVTACIFLLASGLHIRLHHKDSNIVYEFVKLTSMPTRNLYPSTSCIIFNNAGVPKGKWYPHRFTHFLSFYDYPGYTRGTVNDWQQEECKGPFFTQHMVPELDEMNAYKVFPFDDMVASIWEKNPRPAAVMYPMETYRVTGYLKAALEEGWQDPDAEHPWAQTSGSGLLRLPVPTECISAKCLVKLKVNNQNNVNEPLPIIIENLSKPSSRPKSITLAAGTITTLQFPMQTDRLTLDLKLSVAPTATQSEGSLSLHSVELVTESPSSQNAQNRHDMTASNGRPAP